ncbi:hypothetical protein Hanom_Chr01g00088551 [Helianthus anomalus]
MKVIISMLITLLLVIMVTSAQTDTGINNEGVESKISINIATCTELENLPGGHCGKGDCKRLCSRLHGKGAWGNCSGPIECECHWHC